MSIEVYKMKDTLYLIKGHCPDGLPKKDTPMQTWKIYIVSSSYQTNKQTEMSH